VSVYESVLYEVGDRVATITLNRPQVLNAFDAQLRTDLIAAINEAVNDDRVRVAILTGAGRAFSAGADLREATPPEFLPQFQLDDEFKPGLMAIAHSAKPFISAVNGVASGAAVGYAMACDMMMMADNAHLHLAFASVGLVPDAGTTWHLLHRLGPKKAYEIVIGAEKVSAQRCLELGLTNRVVPADGLLTSAHAWATQLSEKAPLVLRYVKESFRKVARMNLADAISYEAALQNRLLRSQDAQEGIRAFLEKRRPRFVGK